MAKMLHSTLFTVLLAALLVSSSLHISAAERELLDFTKTVSHGGQWQVDLSGEEPVVTQNLPTGGITWLLFADLELPESFVFEAELGVISGNHPEHRPYFGLLFNNQFQPPAKLVFPGYRFTFRPSSFRYELEKRTPDSEILAFHTDVMPWLWDLEEWRTLRIRREGERIEAYVNDELIISYSDGEHTGGTVGFWTYSTSAVFRNIRLTAQ